MLPKELSIKYDRLQSILAEMQSVAIGFSGGIDSTLLVRVATDVLGHKALAVIGRSETYPTREFEEAVTMAESFGSRYRVVNTEETDDLKFKENPPDRCYFCKNELFGKLGAIAEEEGIQWIADGTITDDLGDFRPGMRAKSEKNVRSPLLEAGLSKNDVRLIAQRATKQRKRISERRRLSSVSTAFIRHYHSHSTVPGWTSKQKSAASIPNVRSCAS